MAEGMSHHQDERLLSADRPDHRVIHCQAAQVLLAGSDVGDGLLPVQAKALDRFGKRGEAAARLSDLWRLYLAPPIRCDYGNEGLPLTRHLAIGWRGLLHQAAAQV